MKYTVIGVKFGRGNDEEEGFSIPVDADDTLQAILKAKSNMLGSSVMVAAVVYGHVEVAKLLGVTPRT